MGTTFAQRHIGTDYAVVKDARLHQSAEDKASVTSPLRLHHTPSGGYAISVKQIIYTFFFCIKTHFSSLVYLIISDLHKTKNPNLTPLNQLITQQPIYLLLPQNTGSLMRCTKKATRPSRLSNFHNSILTLIVSKVNRSRAPSHRKSNLSLWPLQSIFPE